MNNSSIKKILVIRFSSIGDIVLITPVLRGIKRQYPNAQLHVLTKPTMASLLTANPNVNQVITLTDSIVTTSLALRAQHYDVVLDLHNNLRSAIIKLFLINVKSFSFDKQNINKWLMVQFKQKRQLTHVVERYLACAANIGVTNDGLGLDFYIEPNNQLNLTNEQLPITYIALVIGAKFKTKQLPLHQLITLCTQLTLPIVLIGGKEDSELAQQIINVMPANKAIHNTCGRYNLQQSAALLAQAQSVITHDTGMMHIASAFGKKIITVWGNTTPAIGFSAYLPSTAPEAINIQNNTLNCRPCSKIGFMVCPQGHFNCMNSLDMTAIAKLSNIN